MAEQIQRKKVKKRSQLKALWFQYKKNKLAMFGLILMGLMLLTALCAGIFLDYDTQVIGQSIRQRLQWPSAVHWFGTDEFGRDILSRIIYGSRISLQVGIIAVSISLVVGGLIGAISGYFGGKLDNILMRLMDIQMAIPTILMAIVISSVLGPGLFNLMVAVGITYIPKFARLTRASVLSIKDQEFIEAARAMGASHKRIICLYILPNCAAPLIVQSTLSVANAILFAATLSFLGLGIQPPYPEWGGMLSSARPYLRNNAYMSIFPGLAIMFTILSLNFLGDGLRDALDPKQKR
jgi:peptide/nickel transport system permease protein